MGYFYAPGARIVGDVSLGEDVNIWYNAVLRGDGGSRIVVGARTNIQDGAIVHGEELTQIGADVTIGHGAIVHGCTLGDRTLVGMGAIILSGAVVGRECIIGAGALVTGKANIPDGSMVVGSPAKVVRDITEEERAFLLTHAAEYCALARAGGLMQGG